MDYVVDGVVRRVSSSARRSRSSGGVGDCSVAAFEPGGPVVGGGSSDVPSVVEAVLRIGGSAMGPALVCMYAGTWKCVL